MATQENAIQNAILRYLRAKGYYCWRQNNAPVFDSRKNVYRAHNGLRGLPDIMGFMPLGQLAKPQMFFIECKSQKGRVTKEQTEFLETARTYGHVAFVARSLTDVVSRGF